MAAVDSDTRTQAPMFTKNKHSRLLHVPALAAVATLVIAILGPPNRLQKDAREDRVHVRATSVSENINSEKTYEVPASFAHLRLDPSVHPHQRAGDKLTAEFQKEIVSRFPILFCVAHAVNITCFLLSSQVEAATD